MATYQRKTYDEWHLMIDYGYGHGWEHETTETSWQDAKAQKKCYAENCPQYPTRIVKKRVRIEEGKR